MEKKSFSAEYRTRDSNRSLPLPATSCSKESNCNRDLKSPFQPLLIPLLCSVAVRKQNSDKTRNTEKSYLLLLVRGNWCKVAAVQFGDSPKTN